MKQLIAYSGVAVLVLLGARINPPEVHPEPIPEPPAAVVAVVPVMPEVINGNDPNKPPTAPGAPAQGG